MSGLAGAWVALGAAPVAALVRAFTLAVARRAAIVGTADVLAQAAVPPDGLPPALVGPHRAGLVRLAEGYLISPPQDQPGEVGGWTRGYDDVEVAATLREVEWSVRRVAGLPGRLTREEVEPWSHRPRWTAGVHAALARSLGATRRAGVLFADLSHVTGGMLEVRDCAGARFLFPDDRDRVAALETLQPALARGGEPYPALVVVPAVLAAAARRTRLTRLVGRIAGRLRRPGPMQGAVLEDLKRQAVRVRHDVIGPAHALLGVLALDARMAAARIVVPPDRAAHNHGGALLRAAGADLTRLTARVAALPPPPEPAADLARAQLLAMRPGDPLTGAEMARVVDRAAALSFAHRHADTGTSHLLLALVEHENGSAVRVLRGLDVDVPALRAAVETDLARVPAAWR